MIYLSDDTIRNNVAFGIREDEIADRKVTERTKDEVFADEKEETGE